MDELGQSVSLLFELFLNLHSALGADEVFINLVTRSVELGNDLPAIITDEDHQNHLLSVE